MLQGLDDYLNEEKVRQIAALGHNPSHDELERILSRRIRSEKVAIKDIKLRTFIAEGNSRNDLPPMCTTSLTAASCPARTIWLS